MAAEIVWDGMGSVEGPAGIQCTCFSGTGWMPGFHSVPKVYPDGPGQM